MYHGRIIFGAISLILSLDPDCLIAQATSGYNNFQKQFNPAGKAMDPFCLTNDKTKGYLMAGNYYLPSDSNFVSRTTCLFHVGEKGCVDWSKMMAAGEQEVIQSIISTSDSGYLICAFPYQSPQDNYPNYLNVFKLDKSGNEEWAHSISSGTKTNTFLSVVCETNDRGFVLEMGSFPLAGDHTFISIIKIDRLGRFIWGRALGMEDNSFYHVGGIMERNNLIYATGSVYKGTAPFGIIRSFIVQLDEGTGLPLWTEQNDPGLPALTFLDIHNYKKGLLINSYTDGLLNNLIFSDYEGNITGSMVVDNPYDILNGKGNVLITPDDGIYFHQSSGDRGFTQKDIIMRIDSNRKIVWQHDFFFNGLNIAGWFQLSSAPDNGVTGIGGGKTSNGYNVLNFIKLDSTGGGCNSGDTRLSIENNHVSMLSAGWNMNTSLVMNVTEMPLYLDDIPIESRLSCPESPGGCELLELDGPHVICNVGDTAKYILRHDPLCPDPITLTYDSPAVTVLSNNLSNLELKFTEPGDFVIKVEKNECNRIVDSIMVSVRPGPAFFLPPDTVICVEKPWLLYPLASYKSYSWNTGETGDSVLIRDAGIYALQVVDLFGCMGSDTIRIATKDCPYGIYFPNAFTPNKDGRNDVFKPVILGSLSEYHFSIFNRWGQCVFETADPKKGWDGILKNREQNSEAYIWVCIYQFAGEKKNTEKGSFLLLR